jgi:hypothetical protein
MEDNEMEWKTTKGMEDNEMEWKTGPMLGAQRIYLQHVFHSFSLSSIPFVVFHSISLSSILFLVACDFVPYISCS